MNFKQIPNIALANNPIVYYFIISRLLVFVDSEINFDLHTYNEFNY